MNSIKYLVVLLFLLQGSFLHAQESETFNRKGRILVETGYNLFSGFSRGSGLSVLADGDGDTVTSLGFNGGYFVSQNFALKFNLGLLSSNGTLSNTGIGGKYYIGGVVPLEFGVGTLSAGGNSEFIANISLGYAIPLAKNIAFEPSIGVLGAESSLIEFAMRFAMFL